MTGTIALSLRAVGVAIYFNFLLSPKEFPHQVRYDSKKIFLSKTNLSLQLSEFPIIKKYFISIYCKKCCKFVF